MSTISNEPGLGATIRPLGVIEKNSRKLYGYDFVNYRSDCETSNINGLLKYNDVVNFGRRISEANVHNCVMCGEFDVIIPTQNKDVCKGCDSSFWYNAKLNVTFKFCKGCKNFVTLDMFSDKPDASKCCRCRRRGRENYLTKKFIGSQDMCGTPGFNAESPPNVSPALSVDSAEETLASFKYATSSPSTTPASISRSFHTIPLSGSSGSCPSSTHTSEPSARVARPSKKRSISADSVMSASIAVAMPSGVSAIYAAVPTAVPTVTPSTISMPAKPPKTPRCVSYSVTPSSSGSGASQPRSTLSMLHTPRRKLVLTVTPASYDTTESNSSDGRTVRFARSNSVCSADGATAETRDDPESEYLWNRSTGGQDSPQAVNANVLAPLHYYVPNSSLDSRCAHNCTDPVAGDKENTPDMAVDAIALLHKSCARLFSDAACEDRPEVVPMVSPAVSEAPDFCNYHDHSLYAPQCAEFEKRKVDVPGSHCKDLRRLHSTDSTFSPPAHNSVQSAESAQSTPPEHQYACTTSSSVSTTSSTSSSADGALLSPASTKRRQWEWDPSLNPLMHLAMITERI